MELNALSSKALTIFAGVASLSGAVTSCSGDKAPQRYNVVYIMSDDHSYQTISAYDKRYLDTPNIDRLADEGARFTNSFVANSLSGPSRACMLTGKHSHKNGFTNNEHGIFDGSQQTMPKILQENGYQTAMIGKWHLVSEPTGFDYWDIFRGQGDYYNPEFIRNGESIVREGYASNLVTDVALEWLDNRDKEKPFVLFLHHKAPHRSWMPDTCDLRLFDEKIYPMPETFYDNYEGREAAAIQEMSIIRDMDIVYDLKMADKENEIHSQKHLESYGRSLYRQDLPEDAPIMKGRMSYAQQQAWDAYYDPIIARFKEENLSGEALDEWKYQRYMHDYCRVIHSIDRNIGRVYDYLKEHGLLENTVVIYTSDQGFFMGEHGYFDKRFQYEESFRTPLVVRMPGGKKVKAGRSRTRVLGPDYGPAHSNDISEFVQNIDYAPTILDFAGIQAPEDMQGLSFRPLLEGKDPAKVVTTEGKGWRKSLYYHFYEYPAEHSVRRHYGIRTERYSLMHFYNDIDEWELFDLEKDPRELHNIFGQPGTEALSEKLMNELLNLQNLYDDPIRNN